MRQIVDDDLGKVPHPLDGEAIDGDLAERRGEGVGEGRGDAREGDVVRGAEQQHAADAARRARRRGSSRRRDGARRPHDAVRHDDRAHARRVVEGAGRSSRRRAGLGASPVAARCRPDRTLPRPRACARPPSPRHCGTNPAIRGGLPFLMRGTQESGAVASPPPLGVLQKPARMKSSLRLASSACWVLAATLPAVAPGSLLGLAVQGQRPRFRRRARCSQRHHGSAGHIGRRHLAAPRPRREAAHGLLLLPSRVRGLHPARTGGDTRQRRRDAEPLLAHPAGRLLRALLRQRRQRAAAALRPRRRALRRVAHDAARPAARPDGMAAIVVAARRRPRRRRPTTDAHLPRSRCPSTQGLLFARRLLLLPGRRRASCASPYTTGDLTPSGRPRRRDITIYDVAVAQHWPKTFDIARRRHHLRRQRRRPGRGLRSSPPVPGGILKVDGTRAATSEVAKGFRNPIAMRCERGPRPVLRPGARAGLLPGPGGREKIVPIRQGDDWGFPCCATQNLPYRAIVLDTGSRPTAPGSASETDCLPHRRHAVRPRLRAGQVAGPVDRARLRHLHGPSARGRGARGRHRARSGHRDAADPSTDLDGGESANSDMMDFATGWDDGHQDHGRPAAVTFAPDGRMFIGDDQQGAVILDRAHRADAVGEVGSHEASHPRSGARYRAGRLDPVLVLSRSGVRGCLFGLDRQGDLARRGARRDSRYLGRVPGHVDLRRHELAARSRRQAAHGLVLRPSRLGDLHVAGPQIIPGSDAATPSLSWLTLPVGFCAHYFAHVPTARQLRFAPDGHLFVASPTSPTTGGAGNGVGGHRDRARRRPRRRGRRERHLPRPAALHPGARCSTAATSTSRTA